MEVYRGTILSPRRNGSCRVFPDGGLVVAGSRIQSVGNFDQVAPFGARVIDCRPHLILPGFVDTHTHLPQYEIAGKPAGTLLNWLTTLTFPEERKFPQKAQELSSRFFREMIASGTTSAAVYTTSHAESTDTAFKEALSSGMRVIMGNVLMDRNAPEYLLRNQQLSLPESDGLFDRWQGAGDGRLHYAYTPRFAPACTIPLMLEAGFRALDKGAHIQTHLSENTAEIEWVETLFPGARDYTDVYEGLGLLQQKTILGHCIHLSDRELAVIAKVGSGIAHCPTSNKALDSGIFPMGRVIKHQLRVGLGSDVGAGPTLSMFEVMREAIRLQQELATQNPDAAFGQISPEYALYLATLGGARALRLNKETGGLVPGKAADFIVLDNRALGLNPADPTGLLSGIVNGGTSANVLRTYVDGRQISLLQSHPSLSSLI